MESASSSSDPASESTSTLINVDALNDAFLGAASSGDLKAVSTLLSEGANLLHSNDRGQTALHLACINGHSDIAKYLIESGHPWNLLDHEGVSSGEYARNNGHEDLYNELVSEGCRCEILLGLLGSGDEEEEEEEVIEEQEVEGEEKEEDSGESAKKKRKIAPNADYLSMPLRYEGDKLVDAEDNGVMMGWETSLMVKHAEVICPHEGLEVLNVGFGLGIIDGILQSRKPKKHTIIEAHPDVYKHMLDLGWDKKPGVRILFGRWQDVLDQLEAYDGIFFDTFGEFYDDMKEFHEVLPNILREGGVYSFFNGLCGSNFFFHDVYCQIAKLELEDMGFTVEYVDTEIDASDAKLWDGIKRRYWTLKNYRLPICRLTV